MTFHSRADWQARPSNGAGNPLGAHIKGVAVHYEGPKMGSRPHSQCAALVRTIQRFHQDSRGWADIAYNFAVCEHGDVYEGRGFSRGSAANGTTQANLDYFAVCALVGEGDVHPTALLDGVRDAIDLCRAHGAGSAIVGHRDLFATACPGGPLYAFVKAGAPRSKVTTPAPAKAPSAAPAKTPSLMLPHPAPALPPFPGVTRQSTRVTGAARAFQARLKARGWSVVVDGVHGQQTTAALKSFQKEKGLTPDGVGGPATWTALWKTAVTK